MLRSYKWVILACWLVVVYAAYAACPVSWAGEATTIGSKENHWLTYDGVLNIRVEFDVQ